MGEDITADMMRVGATAWTRCRDWELPWMGGCRRARFWPTWDEAQQSLVDKKPLAEVARSLQPSWGGWESALPQSWHGG